MMAGKAMKKTIYNDLLINVIAMRPDSNFRYLWYPINDIDKLDPNVLGK